MWNLLTGWKLAQLILKLPLVEARFDRSDVAVLPGDPAPAAVAMIALKAWNDRFVSAEVLGRGELVARASTVDSWERFGLIRLRGNRIAFRATNDRFVSAELNADRSLVANRPVILGWESFELVPQPSGAVALRAFNGLFVSAQVDAGGELLASGEALREWEQFTVSLVA